MGLGTNTAYVTCDGLGGAFFMKKMMESLKEMLDGIMHEIDVYMTIQRYQRNTRKYKSA